MCLTIALEAVCCAGTTFCNIACCCCKGLINITFKEQVKLAYICVNYIVMIFTIIALYFIQDIYSSYLTYIGCPESLSDICMGVSGIYRMSFVLAIFYILLTLIMLTRGIIAKSVNDGLWLLKFIFIAIGFYISLYIPNTFFEKYVNISIITSGLYLLFQIIIFIDIFYLWAERWARMYDEGIEGMGSALVAAASFIYTAAIVLNIYNFIWFSQNYYINLINVGQMILVTVVQMLGCNPSGSLLASGCISCFITYQTYAALSSYPDPNINVFYYSEGNMQAQMIVGGILNFVALIYMIFATQENAKITLQVLDKQIEKTNSENQTKNQIEIELAQTSQINDAQNLIQQIEVAPYSTNQYIYFHIILIFNSMFMAMLITNWGSPNISDNAIEVFQPSTLSYYVKLTSGWVCTLLYLWSLLAPAIFPQRFQQQ